MSGLAPPRTRSDLIGLLTEACELEHGLACSYLFAAFSLKQRASEGGLDFEQSRKVKYWASQIFFVAGQEMMHLAQAWNLLSAIGGTPYALRPNLPQDSRYYPLHSRIALEPFSRSTLERFIVYETPSSVADEASAKRASLSPTERSRGHVSIGELYGAIAQGFDSISDLFNAAASSQVGQKAAQFYDLTLVTDKATALAAIKNIVHQGEGASSDRIDCHYGMFATLLREFDELSNVAGDAFQPVRPVMSNPVAGSLGGYGADAHPIREPRTRRCADLFDQVYRLMLQMLSFGFGPTAGPDWSIRTVQGAIEVMTTVIRPLGDALCCLPAGTGEFNGGPGFGLRRFDALPAEPRLAVELIGERLMELGADADTLARELPSAPQIAVAAARMREAAKRLIGMKEHA